jgi:hypothetical protein
MDQLMGFLHSVPLPATLSEMFGSESLNTDKANKHTIGVADNDS